MTFDENDFEDFVPENNTERSLGLFLSARPAPRGKTLVFRAFIGNSILDQLVDAENRSWLSEEVNAITVRLGTGAKQGQMLISASRGGNISLRKSKGEKSSGKWFTVKNLPGMLQMESQKVEWQIIDGQFGKSIFIPKYVTGEVTVEDVKKSDTGVFSEPKPVPKESANVNPPPPDGPRPLPPPPPPPRAEHKRPTRAEAYEALSRAAKAKK